MNVELANKLANLVEVKDNGRYFEATGSLVTGVDTSNGQTAVRVMKDGAAITEWFAADADTVREANRLIRELVDAKNDA